MNKTYLQIKTRISSLSAIEAEGAIVFRILTKVRNCEFRRVKPEIFGLGEYSSFSEVMTKQCVFSSKGRSEYSVGEESESRGVLYSTGQESQFMNPLSITKNYEFIENPSVIEIIERLQSFVSLEEGWDSYKAKKITGYAISKAMELLLQVVRNLRNRNVPIPFLAPLANGGIHIELETLEKKLNLRVPSSFDQNWEAMLTDYGSRTAPKPYPKPCTPDEIFDVIELWLLD